MLGVFSRRNFLTSPSFTAASTRTAQTRGTAPKPNFIIFLAGDPECYDIGAWGATDLKAPNIDALSTFRSTLHELVCCRPGLRTLMRSIADGRYRIRAGVPGNGQTLRPDERTIAATLKPAGYATGIFGKWHQGSTPDTVPIAPGFDRFTGFHAGCIDYYYSHRYYWGEPRAVNYHDLWRYRTEDGQHSTELLAR
jgi:arylsulfatase A-like enzyme